jgi:methylglutaconyl-CoA hydratase
MSDELRVDKHDETLVVTVDRGEGNLFTGEMIDRLAAAVDDAAHDPDLRFIRIRAEGPTFCAGREREGHKPDQLRTEAARIVRLNEALRNTPLTVVTEVQGDAAGFGAGVVAASDVSIAAESATISFPEILGGLAPTIVISWVRFALPHARAFELVATGRKMTAEEAFRWGLVTQIAPIEQLRLQADRFVATLSERHPLGLREVKRFFSQVRPLDPVSAAHAAVDPLVLASLRLDG